MNLRTLLNSFKKSPRPLSSSNQQIEEEIETFFMIGLETPDSADECIAKMKEEPQTFTTHAHLWLIENQYEFTPDQLTELIEFAASQGVLTVLQVLIEKYFVSPNQPFKMVVSAGHAACVNYLLDKGATVAPDENGQLPIHHAAQLGHTETVLVLYHHDKTCMQQTDNNNLNPLNLAYEKEQFDVATQLCITLLNEEDAQVLDYFKTTFLQNYFLQKEVGAFFQQISIKEFQQLVRIAELSPVGAYICTRLAIFSGRLDLLKLLNKFGKFNPNKEYLLICASFGWTNIMKWLVDKKRLPLRGTRNLKGETSLEIAINHDHKEIIPFLAQHFSQEENLAALHLAIKKGKVIGFMALHNVISIPSLTLKHLIFAAIEFNQLEILIKLLPKNNPPPDLRNGFDDTLMHAAARYGHMEIIEWLKSQGYSLDITNHANQTMAHAAAKGNQLAVIASLPLDQLTKADNSGALPIVFTFQFDLLEVTQYLLENGSPGNFELNTLDNILIKVVYHNALKVTKWLLTEKKLLLTINPETTYYFNSLSAEMFILILPHLSGKDEDIHAFLKTKGRYLMDSTVKKSG